MSAQDCDVLVLGGGAAGLFCAFTAGQRGRRVRVLERANRVGKKVLMSGGGRCNFTNTGTGPEHFLSANPHFCKSALARYRPEAFIALVDRHGIAWHEKELGQLFCDESSKLIVRLLLDECAAAAVQVDVDCEVQRVEHSAAGFTLFTSLGTLRAPRLVVATGGLSIPSMGASGFGYELARQFGHALRPTRAGLVPLTLSGRPLEEWSNLSGVALPVEASANGASFANAMLITHRGLSGPALLQISSYWQPGQPLRIDLLPQADAVQLLTDAQRAQPAAELRSVLGELLPKRFAQRFCELLAPSRPMRHLRLPELREIAAKLHAWPVVPSGTEGYRTAEVTLGGVDTQDVSSTSFESRRVPGLHFIGEVLDVTGWLGGYNFQWAWASAHACGNSV
ncbi:MAG TPA: NAD(P)/FAD-dependent oxidoreductase [Solimonas sp.]|nr:NAD(P)/FAD-dependent oxidoreductase [Solimonas sp.]